MHLRRLTMLARVGGFALVASLLGGCSYSMVADGQLRPEVYRNLTDRAKLARGGDLPDDLKTAVITPSELPELIRSVVATAVTPEEIDSYQSSLEAVGVWPRGRDYFEEFLDLAEHQIAGLYWPKNRTLYVVEGASVDVPFSVRLVSGMIRRDIYGEFVLGHELVHAVQHTMFPDLMELAESLKHHDDLAMALSASLEGDALLFGMESAFGDVAAVPPDDFADSTLEEGRELIAEHNPDAPLLIVETLLFPYVFGYPLAFGEREALLEHPAVSTEQVYHESKRQKDEPFTFVDLDVIRRQISERCEIVWHNSLGEFGIRILFNENTPESSPDADDAIWRGWDGDRYVVARCDERDELLWVTLWDTEGDAVEFETAYAAIAGILDQRAGAIVPRSVRRNGREVVVSSAALDDWGTPPLAAPRTRVGTWADVLELLGSVER